MKNTKPTGRTLDMTKGSPMKLLFTFALPLFLGNLLQQFYNLADTSIAGHLRPWPRSEPPRRFTASSQTLPSDLTTAWLST